jgi:hypothetical protein
VNQETFVCKRGILLRCAEKLFAIEAIKKLFVTECASLVPKFSSKEQDTENLHPVNQLTDQPVSLMELHSDSVPQLAIDMLIDLSPSGGLSWLQASKSLFVSSESEKTFHQPNIYSDDLIDDRRAGWMSPMASCCSRTISSPGG